MATLSLITKKIFTKGRMNNLLIVLAVATLAHVINMFGFPAYREDEGTYTSQAWAVINQGKLASYTYWYDHSPVGWLFMAGWHLLTGGFDVAGLTVNSGRIFMAVLHVFSTLFLYKIAFNLTKRKDTAVVAALLFSLTPLAILSHRRVLLDNIMVFWFLFSLFLLTKPLQLRYVIGSAVTFALAVLTKESAVVFLPVMLLIVAYHSHKNNRHFAIVIWFSLVVLIGSYYPLFAFLKDEFFPYGSQFGGTSPHVSLLEALKFHSTRGDGFFLSEGSSFRFSLENSWFPYSPIFLILGLFASTLHLLNYKNKWPFFIALLTVFQTMFILRGLVLDWYIIPILPLFSLSIAFLYAEIVARFAYDPTKYKQARIAAMGFIALVLMFQIGAKFYIFTLDQTKNQVLAIDWVKNNISTDDTILIDNYGFVDLNPELKNIADTNVHYYWKADTDPMIRGGVLKDDWNSVDYMLFTPALKRTIYLDDLPIVQEAYEKSFVVKRFNNYNIMNEGYPVEIREVNNKNGTLRKSWDWYKKNYITADGQVIDNATNSQTTSEAQSYALLRAVWEDDWQTFDTVLNWTMNNLKLSDAHLFAWLAHADGRTLEIKDYTTATDADEDIALALLFASKRWNNEYYEDLGKKIVQDIWKHEVVQINDRYYLIAGTNLRRENGYLTNPSYYSPASYRIFAEIDPEHTWNILADDTYRNLEDIAAATSSNEKTYLIPNWFIVSEDGISETSAPHVNGDADNYGYDAFRLHWRVALDQLWFNNQNAKNFLMNATPFFKKEWEEKKKISAIYSLDGKPVVHYDDISTYVGALSTFMITEPELAIDLFSEQFWPEYNKAGYWDDKQKYYSQNWAWFGTALYAYNLPNLWDSTTNFAKR